MSQEKRFYSAVTALAGVCPSTGPSKSTPPARICRGLRRRPSPGAAAPPSVSVCGIYISVHSGKRRHHSEETDKPGKTTSGLLPLRAETDGCDELIYKLCFLLLLRRSGAAYSNTTHSLSGGIRTRRRSLHSDCGRTPREGGGSCGRGVRGSYKKDEGELKLRHGE